MIFTSFLFKHRFELVYCFNSSISTDVPIFRKRNDEITAKLPVNNNTPNTIRKIPAILLKRGAYSLNLLILDESLSNPNPIKINGNPNPKEKSRRSGMASTKLALDPTQKSITAKTGPIQGVQANPKVVPKRNEPLLVPASPLNDPWKVLLRKGIVINFPM